MSDDRLTVKWIPATKGAVMAELDKDYKGETLHFRAWLALDDGTLEIGRITYVKLPSVNSLALSYDDYDYNWESNYITHIARLVYPEPPE